MNTNKHPPDPGVVIITSTYDSTRVISGDASNALVSRNPVNTTLPSSSNSGGIDFDYAAEYIGSYAIISRDVEAGIYVRLARYGLQVRYRTYTYHSKTFVYNYSKQARNSTQHPASNMRNLL